MATEPPQEEKVFEPLSPVASTAEIVERINELTEALDALPFGMRRRMQKQTMRRQMEAQQPTEE